MKTYFFLFFVFGFSFTEQIILSIKIVFLLNAPCWIVLKIVYSSILINSILPSLCIYHLFLGQTIDDIVEILTLTWIIVESLNYY